MDPVTMGALVSAGSNLVGGLLGSASAKKANKQNIKLQKQFAQEGIQWRVADAKKAGIHPLYALGAQTASFAPSSVGDPLGGAISDMGQNIGRAVDAAGTVGDRVTNKAIMALQLERAGLENELLKSQIAREKAQLGPGFPGTATLVPGQGDTNIVEKVLPPERTPVVRVGGKLVHTDPGTSNLGQFAEDRYGEGPAQWVTGGAALVNDLMYNLKNMSFWDLVRAVDRSTSISKYSGDGGRAKRYFEKYGRRYAR